MTDPGQYYSALIQANATIVAIVGTFLTSYGLIHGEEATRALRRFQAGMRSAESRPLDEQEHRILVGQLP